ncbi:hypothetical protein Dimus_036502 [Dionaea muscipula]
MELESYWYDGICVAIVGVSVILSFYVIWRKELGAGRCRGETKPMSLYESLLVEARPAEEVDGFNLEQVVVLPGGGHVRSNQQLWTSCWRWLHPGWLLGFRFASFCTLAGFMAWDVNKYGATIFVYYTEWTFSLVMLYFAIGSVISAHGCWLLHHCSMKPADLRNEDKIGALRVDLEESTSFEKGKEYGGSIIKPRSQYYQEEVVKRAGFWGYLMQTAYQTSAGAVILTDIVFWCIIVPFLSNAHLGLNLLMGCMHTLNAAFILVDTALNSLPFPLFRITYFVLWGSAYITFQWAIHACGFSWWPYPFLDLSSPSAPLWYLVLAVAHLPCYGLYALIIKAKNSFFSNWFPDAYLGTQ